MVFQDFDLASLLLLIKNSLPESRRKYPFGTSTHLASSTCRYSASTRTTISVLANCSVRSVKSSSKICRQFHTSVLFRHRQTTSFAKERINTHLPNLLRNS